MISHRSVYTPLRFPFTDVGALIVLLFSLCQSEFELHELFLSIQSNRDQCQALDAGFSNQGADFRAMEEELTRTGILVLRVFVGVSVARNQGIGQEELIAAGRHEGSFEADMAGFDGFYLAAGQDDARHIPIKEGVIIRSSATESENLHRG